MTGDEIRAAVETAVRPGCFFVAADKKLCVEYIPHEEVPWQIFQGQLLDHAQTRHREGFQSWNVHVENTAGLRTAPLLSVKFNAFQRRIFITRNILIYAWESYDERPNVIRSRETLKWTPELVGTVNVAKTQNSEALHRQVSIYLLLATVGTSRLPITSLESPLPAFSLGQLAYFRTNPSLTFSRPVNDPADLIDQRLTPDLSPVERARLFETVLRSADSDQVPRLAELFVDRWRTIGLAVEELPALVKTLFNHVALSPYTALVDHLVALLAHWAAPNLVGPEPVTDIFSYLLRHLVRHLAAYDLATFHNLGANYPDALMLDALLRAYLVMIESHPDEFEEHVSETLQVRSVKRWRRRALRQAWLTRKRYEGHRVPEVPTSPGDNRRVLPAPFARVPEEQLLQPTSRSKVLFSGYPTERLLTDSSRKVLQQSILDLEHPTELRELGIAVYLDRPLGVFKQPGEVDRTPLLSYEAFSREIAESRLNDLSRWGHLPTQSDFPRHIQRLLELPIKGFPVSRLDAPERPGVVGLEEAHKLASDFLFLRATRQSLGDFLSQYDFGPLKEREPDLVDWLFSAKSVLMIRAADAAKRKPSEPVLMVYDGQMRLRIEIGLGQESGVPVRYLEFSGAEYLEKGLRVLRVWHFDGTMPHYRHKRGLVDENVVLAPKL